MPDKKLTKLGHKTKELWANPDYRKHMSEVHKGQKAWNAGKKVRTNTGRTHFKKGQVSTMKGKKHTLESRKKMSDALAGRKMPSTSGPNHWKWKGGTSRTASKVIRQSSEYRLWRKAVFERDDYTCVWCGQRGGKLHADHIKPFALYPELRFAIDNGRTLCVECHLKTPTYGGRTQ